MGDPNLYVLRPYEGEGARAPLFLVGVAGVNALGFVALARWLPAEQPVYVVQPTRRVRKFPPEGIGPGGRDEYPLVAADYVASLRTVQPHGPYYLAGSCDGAIVAFEMARRLEAEGERVALLAVLDTWPLERSSVYPLVMLKVWRRGWQERSPAERRALLRRKATEIVGLSPSGTRERGPLPRRRRPVTPAHRCCRARRGARCGGRGCGPGRASGRRSSRLRLPCSACRISPDWRIHDDALGWRERTRGVVTVHILPGYHHNWARPPHVAFYARTLMAYLDTTPPASPPRASMPPPPIVDTEALPERWGRLLSTLAGAAREIAALLQRGS